MTDLATKYSEFDASWDGKGSPFKTSYGKLMMWFFLVSDALTFGGLLVSYGFARYSTLDAWPIGEETFEALPFLGHGYPLAYVALMTFILIISSVTMVLAVEAGHRMDKKGVIKWMIATIVGGLFFVGSQAWEWSHFIHGTDFGSVEILSGEHKGARATVKGHFGAFESFTVLEAGKHHKKGEVITGTPEDLYHDFRHAVEAGLVKNNQITLHDGSVATWKKAQDEHMELIVKSDGNGVALPRTVIKGKDAEKLYWETVNAGHKKSIIYGANLHINEYGPTSYGQFFFFITGFHGFHVFTGVIINFIVFLGVVKGVNHRRGHYEMVEKTGLYWHFVDLVWVFVFTFFYLV